MPVNIRGRHFLKLIDYTPAEIRYLLDLSHNFKDLKRAGTPHRYLEGKNVVLLFEKTSTRTRCAFEVAGRDLGMGVTYLDPGSSQMGKKESIADTAKVLGRMYDGIEYRGFSQKIVEELAAELKIELAAEVLYASAYLLRLLFDIKVVVESHFEHYKTSQYIFCT